MTDTERLLIKKLSSALHPKFTGYQKILSTRKRESAKKDFLKHFTVNIKEKPEYLVQLLKEVKAEKRDPHDIENILFVVIVYNILSDKFVDILIALLKENWHYGHESIVWALQEIKSPRSIDVLYQTAISTIPYLNYSDMGHNSLRLHCVWALGKIGTTEAKEKLRILAKSDVPILRERAAHMLKYGNIGPML